MFLPLICETQSSLHCCYDDVLFCSTWREDILTSCFSKDMVPAIFLRRTFCLFFYEFLCKYLILQHFVIGTQVHIMFGSKLFSHLMVLTLFKRLLFLSHNFSSVGTFKNHPELGSFADQISSTEYMLYLCHNSISDARVCACQLLNGVWYDFG